jgi:hypothetical protein
MSSLFHDKSEAVATLLQHSAEIEDTHSAGVMSDTAFDDFMHGAYRRAGALRAGDLPQDEPHGYKPHGFTSHFATRSLRRPLAWGLAAAALIAFVILVRGMLDGFGDKQNEPLLPGSDTSYQTASESTRIAKIPAAQQIRIAMPRFVTRSAAEEALGDKIAHMIVENLSGSGLFTVVDINAYGDTVSAIDEPKTFSQRHRIDARAFLIGRVVESAHGSEIFVRLWDVPADKQLTEQQYAIDPDNLRGTANRISDLIRQQLAGR